MTFPYLLLGAQAAGIATSIFANESQNRIGKAGLGVDRAQLALRMEQETLAATQETLFDLQNLRETLSTQAAIMGARGQRTGVGTAHAITQKSLNAYGQDENARRINKGFRESYLNSMSRLKRIESEGMKAQRGVQLIGQSLNMLDFSSLFGSTGGLSGQTQSGSKGK